MTLDEAIKHAREKANEQKCHSCKKCAEEHEQLADWLEELKNRRETNFNYVQLMDCRYRDGYNKAIDDLTEKIVGYGTYDYYGNVIDVLEIAEKLKKECAE